MTRFKADNPEGYREYQRSKQAKVRALQPEKKSAWNAVYRAVKAGRLVRPDECGRCGVGCKPEASHDDYARQLDVEWLCKPCHVVKDLRS